MHQLSHYRIELDPQITVMSDLYFSKVWIRLFMAQHEPVKCCSVCLLYAVQ